VEWENAPPKGSAAWHESQKWAWRKEAWDMIKPQEERKSVSTEEHEWRAAIQEMIARNPAFRERIWAQRREDWFHPEQVEERRRKSEEERRATEELRQQDIQQRAREMQAEALVQNQRAELVEQNLGQWIKERKTGITDGTKDERKTTGNPGSSPVSREGWAFPRNS
jgi:hypothetical protein